VQLQNRIAFLVALAFAVAASANLPTILYALFWKKFNTTGALFSMYGGLAVCVLLIVFSPAVSGKATSMIPTVNFSIFPLANPGLVSIRSCWASSAPYGGRRDPFDTEKYAEQRHCRTR